MTPLQHSVENFSYFKKALKIFIVEFQTNGQPTPYGKAQNSRGSFQMTVAQGHLI